MDEYLPIFVYTGMNSNLSSLGIKVPWHSTMFCGMVAAGADANDKMYLNISKIYTRQLILSKTDRLDWY